MEEKNKHLVCVRCITFNHASYIVDALNGFTMQQTTFPFVCTIVDDASTDGEQEVIRNYLEEHFDLEDQSVFLNEETNDYRFVYARHKKNHNCFFAVYFLKYNHNSIKKPKVSYFERWERKSKYLSYCEGDDFWIAPYKLQKQYDILENDSTISFCHHNFYELNEVGEKVLKERIIPTRQNILDVARYNSAQTLTMFFRNIEPLIPSELNGRTVYSQFLTMRLAEFGDIAYIDEPMAVYRRHSGGIFGNQNPSKKLGMFTMNLDNMIYWYNLNNRQDVVTILKSRGRKVCYRYLIHFLRKFELKNALTAYNSMKKYH